MFRGLIWRVGIPILLLVLGVTLALAFLTTYQIRAEQSERMRDVAAADAAFVRESGLPLSEGMLRDLERVTGFDVFVRENGQLLGDGAAELLELDAHATEGHAGEDSLASILHVPADGIVRRSGNQKWVIVPVREGQDLLLASTVGGELFDARVLEVVLACWILALLISWLVVRGLVRPLRGLAGKLPSIESDAQLHVPEARRKDEIGDVARSFVATRQALLDEREERARMEKLALLGRMTASFAHEIQNPIAAIKMHTQLLRGTDADAPAELLEGEVARIESLVQQWMFVSRPEPPAFGALDLASLLEQTLRTHAPRLEHARVVAELQLEGPLPIQGDARRLGQVFANLVSNAMQAMPEGGRLRIEGQPHSEPGSQARFVRVRCVDSGSGFSAAALERFGEFFYSEREGGMGIGLAVAGEIITAHGGTIRASNLGSGLHPSGACVEILLPQDQVPAPPTSPQAEELGEPA
jgi:signal transduction histidine kinase